MAKCNQQAYDLLKGFLKSQLSVSTFFAWEIVDVSAPREKEKYYFNVSLTCDRQCEVCVRFECTADSIKVEHEYELYEVSAIQPRYFWFVVLKSVHDDLSDNAF